jgi:hypothetical protein
MKKISIKVTFSLLMILALLLISSLTVAQGATAFAQGGTRIYLQPVDSPNGTLTVEVIIENVADLYGAEFRLKYDPAVLSVQDLNDEQGGVQIEAGGLLPADKGFVVANKVDEAEGKITFAMTLLNPAPPVSGKGSLARVTFNTLQTTPSIIDIEHAKLVAADLQTIPSETGSLTIGSENQSQATTVPTTAEAPPTTTSESGFPWWIVAVVVMVLGVVVLGGLIVMGGGKSGPVASATTQRPPVRQQPARPSGSRPSAFKQQQNTPADLPPDLTQKPHQFRSQ